MALTNPLYNNLPKLSNIQGFWRFEAGGNAADLSANNYTLTETSGTIDNVAGKIGNAADFEAGDTEYFQIADASCANLGITGEITISFWIKPETAGANSFLMIDKWGGGGHRSYLIYLEQGKINPWLSVDGASPVQALSNTVLSAGNWYHIGFTLNQVTDLMQVYINGSADGNAVSYTGNIFDSDAAFTVGGWTANYDGIIDELIIWNTCLTATEIAQVAAITTLGQYKKAAGGFSGGQPWIFMKDTLDKGKKYFKKKGLWLPDDNLVTI